MTKNAIQEQRMRGYFIEATRQMIRGEGVKSVSIRTVAERAGYSYATLYNYFKNIRDLIFCAAGEFISELDDFIKSQIKPDIQGIESVKSKTKSYINFFVQYPGIFDLFFCEKIPEVRNNNELTLAVHSYLINLLKNDWVLQAEKNGIDNEKSEVIINLHHSFVHGLLTFYVNRGIPNNYKELIDDYEKGLGKIIEIL